MMKTTTRISWAMLLLGLTWQLGAQVPGRWPQPPGSLTTIDPVTGLPASVERPVFPEEVEAKEIREFNLEGIPLEEVVANLHQQFPQMNFVLSESVKEWERNAGPITLKLRNARLSQILDAICYSKDLKITWSLVGGNLLVFQVQPEFGGGGAGGFGMPGASPPVNKSVQVISFSRYVRGLNQEESKKLLDEIQSLTMDTLVRLYDDFNPQTQMTTCNYHPGTGVLILVGPDFANKIFLDVLRNVDVRGSAGSTPVEIPQLDSPQNPAPPKANKPVKSP